MVPGTGIEPVRYFYRKILSLVRLPISPPGLASELEAGVGIEPAYTELQSAA